MINLPFNMGHGHDKKSIAELRLGMDIGRWQRQKSVQTDKNMAGWRCGGWWVHDTTQRGARAHAHLTSPRPR